MGPVTSCDAPAPPPPAPLPANLGVTVLDDSDGLPIKGADVTINGPQSGNKPTDGGGNALFTGISPGTYTATAAYRGYADGSGTGTAPAGGTGSATVRLKPLTIEVVELGFEGDFDLTKWDSAAGTPGAAITDPVWKKAANPDLPVCYKMEDDKMKLAPKIKVTPAPSRAETLTIKAVAGAPALTFQKDGIAVSSADASITGVPVTAGKLEKKVTIISVSLNWSYSWDGGAKWKTANTTGPHKLYQVYGPPKEAPLYDFALDKACGYANGQSDIDEIAKKINKGIPADLKYDPSDYPAGHPLTYYNNGKCLCYNNAALLKYLSRSLGVDAEVIYIWGGLAGDRLSYKGAGGERCSFQVIVAAKDYAPKDPHFTYHVQTIINATTYDPSYGNVGLINLAETDPNANRQTKTGDTWPPWSANTNTAYKCPHP